MTGRWGSALDDTRLPSSPGSEEERWSPIASGQSAGGLADSWGGSTEAHASTPFRSKQEELEAWDLIHVEERLAAVERRLLAAEADACDAHTTTKAQMARMAEGLAKLGQGLGQRLGVLEQCMEDQIGQRLGVLEQRMDDQISVTADFDTARALTSARLDERTADLRAELARGLERLEAEGEASVNRAVAALGLTAPSPETLVPQAAVAAETLAAEALRADALLERVATLQDSHTAQVQSATQLAAQLRDSQAEQDRKMSEFANQWHEERRNVSEIASQLRDTQAEQARQMAEFASRCTSQSASPLAGLLAQKVGRISVNGTPMQAQSPTAQAAATVAAAAEGLEGLAALAVAGKLSIHEFASAVGAPSAAVPAASAPASAAPIVATSRPLEPAAVSPTVRSSARCVSPKLAAFTANRRVAFNLHDATAPEVFSMQTPRSAPSSPLRSGFQQAAPGVLQEPPSFDSLSQLAATVTAVEAVEKMVDATKRFVEETSPRSWASALSGISSPCTDRPPMRASSPAQFSGTRSPPWAFLPQQLPPSRQQSPTPQLRQTSPPAGQPLAGSGAPFCTFSPLLRAGAAVQASALQGVRPEASVESPAPKSRPQLLARAASAQALPSAPSRTSSTLRGQAPAGVSPSAVSPPGGRRARPGELSVSPAPAPARLAPRLMTASPPPRATCAGGMPDGGPFSFHVEAPKDRSEHSSNPYSASVARCSPATKAQL